MLAKVRETRHNRHWAVRLGAMANGLLSARSRASPAPRLSPTGTILRFVAAGLVAMVIIAGAVVAVARNQAQRVSINDARDFTVAEGSAAVGPVLSNGLLTGDPSAISAVDRAVKTHVLSNRAGAVLTLGAQRRAAEGLRPREREVLSALCEGLANKQIARRLGISEKTVKTHLTAVFSRIGVQDRTQAVLWAQRNGLADAKEQAPRS